MVCPNPLLSYSGTERANQSYDGQVGPGRIQKTDKAETSAMRTCCCGCLSQRFDLGLLRIPGVDVMQCCSRTCKSTCLDFQSETMGFSVLKTNTKLSRIKHRVHKSAILLSCWAEKIALLTIITPGSRLTQQYLQQRCTKLWLLVWSHVFVASPNLVPSPVGQYVCPSFMFDGLISKIRSQICMRLPCDESCSNVLECGRTCPSSEPLFVLQLLMSAYLRRCGLPCAQQKYIKASSESKQEIVNFITHRRLEDINLASADILERLIMLDRGDSRWNLQEYYLRST